jgi:hypothetical protein
VENVLSETDKIGIQISELAIKNSIPSEDLVAEYQKNYSELSEKGVVNNLEKLAMNSVLNLVRKLTKKSTFEPKAKAESIVCFVIGDSGSWDKVSQIRGEASRYVNKHGMAAAATVGYINADSKVLDTRKEVFGKENPMYRMPLKDTQHERSRTLTIIGKVGESDEWQDGTFQTNDNQLSIGWGKVRTFALAQTFGIVKEEKPLRLNSSNAEDTRSIFKAVHEPLDIDAIFMKVVGPQIIQVDNLEESYAVLPRNAKGKVPFDNRFYVKGTVTWIGRDRPTPWGSIKMGIWNPETGAEAIVDIPAHLSVDFGENSEIITIGKLDKGDLKTEGESGKFKYLKGEGAVKINALGFYKIPNMTTPSETSSAEALQEEEDINAWIE